VRFRAKLVDLKLAGPIFLAFGLNLGLYLIQELTRPSELHKLLATLWALSFLLLPGGFLALRYIYWEPTPDCLIVRRLWRKREIPWSEVTYVGWRGTMSGTFRVNVGHRIEEYERLYFEPSDRAGLADALRKFAPHANFKLD
jgi:hypothetical protein